MSAPLPDRRQAPSAEIEWNGRRWRLQFGVAPADEGLRVREIFIDPVGAIGPAMLAFVHDSAVLASLWLRDVGPASVMAKRLERQNGSLLALAFAAAATIELQLEADGP